MFICLLSQNYTHTGDLESVWPPRDMQGVNMHLEINYPRVFQNHCASLEITGKIQTEGGKKASKIFLWTRYRQVKGIIYPFSCSSWGWAWHHSCPDHSCWAGLPGEGHSWVWNPLPWNTFSQPGETGRGGDFITWASPVCCTALGHCPAHSPVRKVWSDSPGLSRSFLSRQIPSTGWMSAGWNTKMDLLEQASHSANVA